MNTIHYSRTKIGLVILVPGLFLASSLIAPFIGEWGYFGAMLVVNVVLGPIVIWGLRFINDNTAARIGPNALEVYGIFQTKKIPYEHIIRMEIETDNSGYKPTRQLVIDCAFQNAGKARISERFLDHKTESLDRILDRMEMAASGVSAPVCPTQSNRGSSRSSATRAPSAGVAGVRTRAGGFGRKAV